MKKHEKLAKEIRELINDDGNYIIDGAHKCVDIKDVESILDKICPIEKPFPKEMISTDGQRVYFIKSGEGIGIDPVEKEILKGWEMEYFKDCEIQIK